MGTSHSRGAREVIRRLTRAASALVAATAISALAQPTAQLIFTPPFPEPGQPISVFIRITAAPNSFVLCPEAERIITNVQVSGNTVLLDLSSVAIAGGFARPFCDGNTVSIGALDAGIYTVVARFVLRNGTVVSPPFITQQFLVGNVRAVPLWDGTWITACFMLMLLAAAWQRRLVAGRRGCRDAR